MVILKTSPSQIAIPFFNVASILGNFLTYENLQMFNQFGQYQFSSVS